MPKIRTIKKYIASKYPIEAPLSYSTKVGVFYVPLSSIVGPFDKTALMSYFLAMVTSKTSGIGVDYIRTTRRIEAIVGDSEQKCEDNLSTFLKDFFSIKSVKEKVILYSLKYQTKEISNDRFSRDREKLYIEFDYHIAIKEVIGDKSQYFHENGHRMSSYDTDRKKEIPWSQELEDFLKGFDRAFHDLVVKMMPFFTEDNKILELVNNQLKLL